MVFADDWHVGQVFFSMLWFFLFFIWIWLLIMVFADIFRDHEMSGWAKAAWVIFVIIVPYLGVFVYLIVRAARCTSARWQQQQKADEQFKQYVQSAAHGSGRRKHGRRARTARRPQEQGRDHRRRVRAGESEGARLTPLLLSHEHKVAGQQRDDGRAADPRAGQFLMTLDSSVMNVSIATVAKDVGTDVTGIQTAITLYTLVMASLMITGGKIGELIGRRRAFAIGCVIYGVRIVHHRARAEPRRPPHRLVVPRRSRRRADHAGDRRAGRVQLPAAKSARAPTGWSPRRAPSPSPPGRSSAAFFTTYLSWRLVFAGEVLVVLGILALARKMADAPPRRRGAGSTSSAPRCRPPGWRSSCSGCSAPACGAVVQPEAGRTRVARPVARDLAPPRRRCRRVAVLRAGSSG